MKKFLSILLILCLVVASTALAETLSFTAKTGDDSAIKTKSTATGTAGNVSITTNEGSHSMYYQIRKTDGVAASEYKNTSAETSFSLSYKDDGYGMSLGRNNYSYRLRVAHRSQCSCDASNEFDVVFSWNP
ncbi:MAG: hypothetical protein IJ418_00270 [Clostridia bacterium]|nr:hypothetical protein [Clostridia bacterium]